MALLRKGHELDLIARLRDVRNQRLGGLDAVARLGGTRRGAAAQPGQLLAGEVLAALFHGIGLAGTLGAGKGPIVVAALVGIDHAIVYLPGPRGHGIEEPAIVSNHDHGQVALEQVVREPLHAFHVEVVGRLVEHHEVQILHQRGGQVHAAALATGERTHRSIEPKIYNAQPA